jgi:hypothetical protein
MYLPTFVEVTYSSSVTVFKFECAQVVFRVMFTTFFLLGVCEFVRP